ncbi:hypothetical protein ACS0TY_014015 [Phlomoides rotata]
MLFTPRFIILSQPECEASVKDLESLVSLLSRKKSKMEQEEAETNLQILLDFMHCLRKKKLDELNEIQSDLQHIKKYIHAVERHRVELYQIKDNPLRNGSLHQTYEEFQ